MEDQEIFEWNKQGNADHLKQYLEGLKNICDIISLIPLSYTGGLYGNEVDHVLIVATKIK